MASDSIFVLPGDPIDGSILPCHPTKALRLGPGLRHVPPKQILPTLAGQLLVDKHKNAMRVETSRGRYIPRAGELVIGTISKSVADAYQVLISPYTAPVSLNHLSFELATRKTRPVLLAGALVYARVSVAHKHMDAEVECVSATTGKSDGLGPLTGGMLFDISLGMARRLLIPKPAQHAKLVVLDELAANGLQFDTATGRNGKFWVGSHSAATVIAVGRAIQDTDVNNLSIDAQRKLVRLLIKNTG
ncbi:hypothetical protein CDD81_7425 [Ophiocordyceps australis]|uniref:Ribosomal RNA-processing protein 40 n=1 Tax=Ophiocordyceps australis TaxID=1399860 RepID=A0A2C5YFV8_9HYPO|nr:hypothetical protein CDD81_7425 [Ophiocordyceps australis]